MSLPFIAGALVLFAASVPQPTRQDTINQERARRGVEVFQARGCATCHEVSTNRRVGPGLLGVTERRSYSWFEGMISRPDSMVRHDEEARRLFDEYGFPMPNLSVAKPDIQAIWEYLLDEATHGSVEGETESDAEIGVATQG